jgi:hypothetical protein
MYHAPHVVSTETETPQLSPVEPFTADGMATNARVHSWYRSDREMNCPIAIGPALRA